MNEKSFLKSGKWFKTALHSFSLVALVVSALAFPQSNAHSQYGEIELFASGLWGPFGMAFDSSGNLFVANEGSGGGGDRVDVIAPDGTVTTHASGFFGVAGVVFNSLEELFVSDDTNRVFKIDGYESYTVFIDETIGLQNPNAIAFDSVNNLYVVSAGGFVSKFDSVGNLIALNFAGGFHTPEAIVIDEAHNRFFISDMSGSITSVDLSSGTTSPYAFTGAYTDGGLAMDVYGNLFYSAMNENRILKIDAGDQSVSVCLYNISQPRGLAFDSSGWLYVTSYDTGTIHRANGCMPPYYDPTFAVWLNQNKVDGYGWPENAQVTLMVGDPASPEIQVTETVGNANLGFQGIRFQFGDEFQLINGQTVTLSLSDGSYSRSHTVTDLIVSGINADTNIVTGTALPGSTVEINNTWDSQVWRHEIAGADGSWTANFNIEGDEPGEIVAEIKPGEEYHVCQFAQEGSTCWHLPLLNPVIGVLAYANIIEGWGWPEGATVTVTVDDPDTTESPDLTLTAEVYESSWNPGEYIFTINLQDEFDIQPGFIVTATDGTTTKTHVVSTLSFTNFELEQGNVSGIADPEQLVSVWTCDDDLCAYRETTADQDGKWSVNFANPGPQDWEWQTADIQNGGWFDSQVWDEEGNTTMFSIWIGPGAFNVDPDAQFIHLHGWQIGSTLELSINDPSTGPEIDYKISDITVSQYAVNVHFDYILDAGFIVTVSDGTFSTSHTVTSLKIISADLDTNIVSGIGDVGKLITVDSHSDPITRQETYPNPDGYWEVDFSSDGLKAGYTIRANQYDEVGRNSTQTHFWIKNTTIQVQLNDNRISGWAWSEGATITIAVDDPATPEEPDIYMTTEVFQAGWPHEHIWYFEIDLQGEIDIQPGFVITATDGITEKIHIVTSLTITDVDIDNDLVTGIADPFQVVITTACSEFSCSDRERVADQDGTWTADFSISGDYPNENQLIDIDEGNFIRSEAFDDDDDSTMIIYNWYPYWEPVIALEKYTFNFNNPLLADVNIRQAIALGTDRQRILDQAFLPGGEYGQILNSPIPPGNPYLAPAAELTLYSYNPLEASALLENAGWVDTNGDGIRDKDGQELSFIFRTTLNPMRAMAAQIFRENMLAIGIDIMVIQDPDFVNIVSGNFDIAEFAWGIQSFESSLFIDPSAMLDIYQTVSDQNFGFYNNPDFEAAMEAIKNAETEEERIATSILAQQIFTADLPAFYLFTRENLVPHQTPEGTSVTLTPLPQVTITYTNVDQEGVTAALAVSFNPADLPENMELVGSAYEIGTTAMFETVQVCLSYSDYGLSPEQESALRLYHYHNGVWLDVTDPGSPDTINNIVCGTATDFSMFAVLLPLNQPPHITSITAPIDPVQIGQTITATVVFSDPNINDTHTATWDWGDGSITTVPAVQPTASAEHVYDTPGVYTITVTITDAADESDSAIHQYVVIYDPDGGFVTGGGWIWSPEGAYTPEPELTGRATFAFVSKYKKGANTPTGNTVFQFHVADMNFRSDSYDWLVVAGSKAIYKGSGTINGEGDYGFMLSAIDGSPDRFRIKIWVKATDEVIYDNMLGMPDNTDPTTAVQGGSIIIHNTK